MTSENWAVQVNVKVPVDPNDNYRDTLVNLRADTAEQAELILAWAEGHAADIARVAQAIAASGRVVAAFPGPGTGNVQVQPEPAPQGQWGQPQGPPPAWGQQGTQQYQQPQQQAPQQPQGGGPAPFCAHGPMVYKEAAPGSGKNWRAWMCTAPKGPGQCDPQWLPKGR